MIDKKDLEYCWNAALDASNSSDFRDEDGSLNTEVYLRYQNNVFSMVLAKNEQVIKDLEVLAIVGRMYLDAIEADPELEFVSGTQALVLTEVREAVDRVERRT